MGCCLGAERNVVNGNPDPSDSRTSATRSKAAQPSQLKSNNNNNGSPPSNNLCALTSTMSSASDTHKGNAHTGRSTVSGALDGVSGGREEGNFSVSGDKATCGGGPYSALQTHGVSGPPQRCMDSREVDAVVQDGLRTDAKKSPKTQSSGNQMPPSATAGAAVTTSATPSAAPTNSIFQSFTRLLFAPSTAKASETVPKIRGSGSHSLSRSTFNKESGSSGAGQTESRGLAIGVATELEHHPHLFLGAQGKDGQTARSGDSCPPLKNQPPKKDTARGGAITTFTKSSANRSSSNDNDKATPPAQSAKVTREALIALMEGGGSGGNPKNTTAAEPTADNIEDTILSPEGLVRLQEEQHRVADFFRNIMVAQQASTPQGKAQLQNAIAAMNSAGSPLSLNPILKDNRFTRADPTHKMTIEEIYFAAVEASNKKILDASTQRVMGWAVDNGPLAPPAEIEPSESSDAGAFQHAVRGNAPPTVANNPYGVMPAALPRQQPAQHIQHMSAQLPTMPPTAPQLQLPQQQQFFDPAQQLEMAALQQQQWFMMQQQLQLQQQQLFQQQFMQQQLHQQPHQAGVYPMSTQIYQVPNENGSSQAIATAVEHQPPHNPYQHLADAFPSQNRDDGGRGDAPVCRMARENFVEVATNQKQQVSLDSSEVFPRQQHGDDDALLNPIPAGVSGQLGNRGHSSEKDDMAAFSEQEEDTTFGPGGSKPRRPVATLQSPPSFASHTPLPPALTLGGVQRVTSSAAKGAHQHNNGSNYNNNNVNNSYTYTSTGGEEQIEADPSLDSGALINFSAVGAAAVVPEPFAKTAQKPPHSELPTQATGTTPNLMPNPQPSAFKAVVQQSQQQPPIQSNFGTSAVIGGGGVGGGFHTGAINNANMGTSTFGHSNLRNGELPTNTSSFDERAEEPDYNPDNNWEYAPPPPSIRLHPVNNTLASNTTKDGTHLAFVSPMLPPTLIAIASAQPSLKNPHGAGASTSPDSTRGSSGADKKTTQHTDDVFLPKPQQTETYVQVSHIPTTNQDPISAENQLRHHFFHPKYLQKVERYNERKVLREAAGERSSFSDQEGPGYIEPRAEDDTTIKPPPPISTIFSELTDMPTDDGSATNVNIYGPGGSDSSFNFSSMNKMTIQRARKVSQGGPVTIAEVPPGQNQSGLVGNNSSSTYGANDISRDFNISSGTLKPPVNATLLNGIVGSPMSAGDHLVEVTPLSP